ncbi:YcxB family protein [Lysobacter sp. 5GHs7-4]|uniref:YcxB family protein n=1 Tax=Lysobacter sp. 5GHs7-4 TaxID=2904253 RepID=UPI001E2E6DDC|nr:YcxB family protein [Lysobacter sp. 5GHs7-4]UHQ24308.1 YcxB family protein [Lysobacter sp. 5GHs7-4]
MSSAATDPVALEVRFRYSFWDRVRCGLVMAFQTPWSALVFLAVPLAGLGQLWLHEYRGLPIDAPFVAVIAAAVCFPVLVQVISAIAVHCFGAHKRRTYQYDFGDFGLRAHSDTEEWTQSWKAITLVKRQGGFLLLFFSSRCAHCLPARQLQQHNALQPILSLARAHGVNVRGA